MTKMEDRIKRLIVKYSDSMIRIKTNKQFAIDNNLDIIAIRQCDARLSSHKMFLNELIELRKVSKEG